MADQRDWGVVKDLAEEVLGFAPDNSDANGFLDVANQRLAQITSDESDIAKVSKPGQPTTSPRSSLNDQPTSFSNGRYQVKRFLGEGGKKEGLPGH